jgi:hypothetical protein
MLMTNNMTTTRITTRTTICNVAQFSPELSQVQFRQSRAGSQILSTWPIHPEPFAHGGEVFLRTARAVNQGAP